MTVSRARQATPASNDGPSRLLIPLDAHEAMLALARFRYSAEREQSARTGETPGERSSER